MPSIIKFYSATPIINRLLAVPLWIAECASTIGNQHSERIKLMQVEEALRELEQPLPQFPLG